MAKSIPLSKLMEHDLLSAQTLKALENANVRTVAQVRKMSKKKLLSTEGISSHRVQEIQNGIEAFSELITKEGLGSKAESKKQKAEKRKELTRTKNAGKENSGSRSKSGAKAKEISGATENIEISQDQEKEKIKNVGFFVVLVLIIVTFVWAFYTGNLILLVGIPLLAFGVILFAGQIGMLIFLPFVAILNWFISLLVGDNVEVSNHAQKFIFGLLFMSLFALVVYWLYK